MTRPEELTDLQKAILLFAKDNGGEFGYKDAEVLAWVIGHGVRWRDAVYGYRKAIESHEKTGRPLRVYVRHLINLPEVQS
jgi:hypothetical protein